MALERTYNVPLRKEFMKAPKYKRAKKAVNAIKKFLNRHMKSDNIKLGKNLNLEIWKHGIKNPPHHVRINAIKGDDGIVKAELEGFEYREMTKEEKEKSEKERKKKEAPKEVEKKAEKKEEVKEEKKEQDKREELKEEKVEKEEEPKKEAPKKQTKSKK